MQSDSAVIERPSETPPTFIRLLAQLTTTLHFIESVGVTFILWLCPSLAPEPRIHQYVSSSPSANTIYHHHHHHHHHHIIHERSIDKADLDRAESISEDSDPMADDLREVDRALEHVASHIERRGDRLRDSDW